MQLLMKHVDITPASSVWDESHSKDLQHLVWSGFPVPWQPFTDCWQVYVWTEHTHFNGIQGFSKISILCLRRKPKYQDLDLIVYILFQEKGDMWIPTWKYLCYAMNLNEIICLSILNRTLKKFVSFPNFFLVLI